MDPAILNSRTRFPLSACSSLLPSSLSLSLCCNSLYYCVLGTMTTSRRAQGDPPKGTSRKPLLPIGEGAACSSLGSMPS